MKDLKKKYGEESREDKKNRHKKLFLPSVISLAICIAMVIVGKVIYIKFSHSNLGIIYIFLTPFVLFCFLGYQYKDDCNVNAATFLLLGGGIVLATSALNVVAYLTPCDWDDRLVDVLTPLAYFAHFVIMIWGSITIFGTYLGQIHMVHLQTTGKLWTTHP